MTQEYDLSLRLGFFWTAMNIADILAGFIFLDFCIFVLCNRDGDGCLCWRWADIPCNIKGRNTHIENRAFGHTYSAYLHMFNANTIMWDC